MARPPRSRSSLPLPIVVSVALHAAVVAALVPFVYRLPAAPEAPLEITVIAAAGEAAQSNGQAPPAQDAAMAEQPVPATTPPNETVPALTEAAQMIPPPQARVPQVAPPPEPAQIALVPPPMPVTPASSESHPPAPKVVAERPRVVKVTARVTPPPTPLPQGEGEALSSATARVAGGSPSADALTAWQRALVAWLDAHRAYPEAARRRGEQGAVGVRFTLTETGEVTTADLQRGSGSATLDDATLAMLRGARLPPPPPGIDAARRTISVSIRYQLDH
jgi:protein TonB